MVSPDFYKAKTATLPRQKMNMTVYYVQILHRVSMNVQLLFAN